MIERLIDACARHRTFVLLAAIAAFGLGLYAMRRVPLDALPDLGDPQVIVFTEWPGRPPTTVEDQVTYPLVTSLLSLPGVTDVRGQSMFGMSFVYAVFDEDTPLDRARTSVNERLAQVRSRLPEGADVQLGPDASGIGWIYQYVLVDETGRHDLGEMRALHDTTIRFALASVPGVAEVASLGGFEPEIEVRVDPARLAARGRTFAEVRDAVRAANGERGGRLLELAEREYFIRAPGYVGTLADLESAQIATDETGLPVRVGDVATVTSAPALRRGAADLDGRGDVVSGIVIQRQGENAREVIERVRERLATLESALPEGVRIVTAYDRSGLIDRAIDTLRRTLAEEVAVVCLVILIFLLHPRSALLPALSLPLVVVLAFIPMAFFGVPATIMSLGGIAIAIGATVDAEIVMIEACHKRLESLGENATEDERHTALAAAARSVTPAIFFSLLILAASFLPVFGLTGQAGRLFRPLAFTKTFVMLAAALVSVTVGPALRDALVQGRILPETRHPISRAIRKVYEPFVHAALRNPRTTLLIGVFALASIVPIVPGLRSEFMPPLDEGDMLYMPTTLPGVSIEEARRVLAVQDRILRSFPEVELVLGKVGRADTPTDPAPLSMVETVVKLKPRAMWRTRHVRRFYAGTPAFLRPMFAALLPEFVLMSREDLVREMDAALRIPGYSNAFTQPIRNRIDMLATGIRTPVGIKIFGEDRAAIERTGVRIESIVRGLPGTRSVIFERTEGGLYVDVDPDRDALARAGLRVGDVEEAVEEAMGGVEVGVRVDGRRRYPLRVRLAPDARDRIEDLEELLVAGVRLGDVASVHLVEGPSMVRDEAGSAVGYVFVDVDDSVDLGGYVAGLEAHLERAVASGGLTLPPSGYLRYSGQFEELERMRARMAVLMPLALLVTVILLYLQFRDLTEVGIVLLSVPFALVGSVWAVHLAGYAISTATLVGFIALLGLAAQTGVVMIVYIDEAYHRRLREGRVNCFEDVVAAHAEGTVERVRPKLMTVGTMLAGLLPLLFAEGSGADVMRRIAAPMVGGLLSSAFLTLELIPVVYTYFRWEQRVHALLAERSDPRLPNLRALQSLVGTGGTVALVAGVASFFEPARAVDVLAIVATCVTLLACAAYVLVRREPADTIDREGKSPA